MRVNGTMLDLLRHLKDKWRILSSFLDRFPRVEAPLYEKNLSDLANFLESPP